MAQDIEALLPLDPPCLERMPSCSAQAAQASSSKPSKMTTHRWRATEQAAPQTGHSLKNVPVDDQICDILSCRDMGLRPQMIVGCTPQMSEVLIFSRLCSTVWEHQASVQERQNSWDAVIFVDLFLNCSHLCLHRHFSSTKCGMLRSAYFITDCERGMLYVSCLVRDTASCSSRFYTNQQCTNCRNNLAGDKTAWYCECVTLRGKNQK